MSREVAVSRMAGMAGMGHGTRLRLMTRVDLATVAVDYSAMCRQAHALGGYSYDFMPLPDRRLAVAVGDASGKSLAAALMVAHVRLDKQDYLGIKEPDAIYLRLAGLSEGSPDSWWPRAHFRQVWPLGAKWPTPQPRPFRRNLGLPHAKKGHSAGPASRNILCLP